MKTVKEIKKTKEALEAQGLTVKEWIKGDNHRLYCSGFHYSKSFWIDVKKMVYGANRPGAYTDAREYIEKAKIKGLKQV